MLRNLTTMSQRRSQHIYMVGPTLLPFLSSPKKLHALQQAAFLSWNHRIGDFGDDKNPGTQCSKLGGQKLPFVSTVDVAIIAGSDVSFSLASGQLWSLRSVSFWLLLSECSSTQTKENGEKQVLAFCQQRKLFNCCSTPDMQRHFFIFQLKWLLKVTGSETDASAFKKLSSPPNHQKTSRNFTKQISWVSCYPTPTCTIPSHRQRLRTLVEFLVLKSHASQFSRSMPCTDSRGWETAGTSGNCTFSSRIHCDLDVGRSGCRALVDLIKQELRLQQSGAFNYLSLYSTIILQICAYEGWQKNSRCRRFATKKSCQPLHQWSMRIIQVEIMWSDLTDVFWLEKWLKKVERIQIIQQAKREVMCSLTSSILSGFLILVFRISLSISVRCSIISVRSYVYAEIAWSGCGPSKTLTNDIPLRKGAEMNEDSFPCLAETKRTWRTISTTATSAWRRKWYRKVCKSFFIWMLLSSISET